MVIPLLELTPINLDEANAFVEKHHRHHKPVPGAKFAAAISDGNEVRGVVIVGRLVARVADIPSVYYGSRRCHWDRFYNGDNDL